MYDVAIVGGGIVGLATAHAFIERSPRLKLLVLEKEPELARHQTAHNSGVIHSGIYYQPGSLKARICRDGVARLTAYCERRGIRYELCGKVIVATTTDECERLDALLRRGQENGVPELRMIGKEELSEIEPHAAGERAILSPSTGIVRYRDVALALSDDVTTHGGHIRCGARVNRITARESSCVLETAAGAFESKIVVSCAGLHADRVAKSAGFSPNVAIVPFRGEYYRLTPDARRLVRHMIYPVPDPRFPFLGVHFTRGIDGGIEAGPNAVLAFAREGYRRTHVSGRDVAELVRFAGFWRLARRHYRVAIDEHHRSLSKRKFVRSLAKLVPSIRAEDLEPGGAGVRAMALASDGELVDDFRVVRDGRMVHVLNAPSPAATSSLAIGAHIVELVAPEMC